jgi:hypothetical protein
MVGQRVIGRAAESRDQETHDAVMEELAIVKEELKLAREERKELRKLMAQNNITVSNTSK